MSPWGRWPAPVQSCICGNVSALNGASPLSLSNHQYGLLIEEQRLATRHLPLLARGGQLAVPLDHDLTAQAFYPGPERDIANAAVHTLSVVLHKALHDATSIIVIE